MQNSINRQVFEFTCSSEFIAKDLQQEITNYTFSQINSIILGVITPQTKSDTLKISKIEVDLQDVLIGEFGKQEMLNKFRLLFTSQLEKAIGALFYLAGNKKITFSNLTGTIKDEFELFRIFIAEGDMPWWFDKSNDINWSVLLRRQVRENSSDIVKLLEKQLSNEPALIRLNSLCNDKTRNLIHSLVPALLFRCASANFLHDSKVPITIRSIPHKHIPHFKKWLKQKKFFLKEESKQLLIYKVLRVFNSRVIELLSSFLNLSQQESIFLQDFLRKRDKWYRTDRKKCIGFFNKLNAVQLEFILFYATTENVIEDHVMPAKISVRYEKNTFSSSTQVNNYESVLSRENIPIETINESHKSGQTLRSSEELSGEEEKNIKDWTTTYPYSQITPPFTSASFYQRIKEIFSGYKVNNLESKRLERPCLNLFFAETLINIGHSDFKEESHTYVVSSNQVSSVGPNESIEGSGGKLLKKDFPLIYQPKTDIDQTKTFPTSNAKNATFDEIRHDSIEHNMSSTINRTKNIENQNSSTVIDSDADAGDGGQNFSSIGDGSSYAIFTGNNRKSPVQLKALHSSSSVINNFINTKDIASKDSDRRNELGNSGQDGIITMAGTPNHGTINREMNSSPFREGNLDFHPYESTIDDNNIEYKEILYIVKKLKSNDQNLGVYLQSLDENNFLKLRQALNSRLNIEKSYRKTVKNLLSHPSLLKYNLLGLFFYLDLQPVSSVSNNTIEDLNNELSKNVVMPHQLLKKLQLSQSLFFEHVKRQSLKNMVILSDVIRKKEFVTKSEEAVVRKFVEGLPGKCLKLLESFAEISEEELDNIFEQDLVLKEIGTNLYIPQNENFSKIYVNNAGLCLISLYLPTLFSQLKFLENGCFKNKYAALKAIFLLQYIVTGKSKSPEYCLQLNKILCGLNPEDPIIMVRLSKKEMDEADNLLEAVIRNWSALKNTSLKGFREAFIQRRGILVRGDIYWTLQIERKGQDFLLGTIPWSYNMIKLTWMKKMVNIEW